MSNKEPFSRKDCRKARNLAMFWEVRRDGLTQDEVAAKYGISQQRVSAILRRMALYVALAPSKEYENIPQLGQMQYTYRIWLERMEQRRGDVHKAFKESMKGASGYRRSETTKKMAGEDQKGGYTLSTQVETAKTQYGDWRLDKMLERIDQSISETRLVLYGRNWHGWELLEKEELTRSGGKKRKRMRNSELGMRNEGTADAVVGSAAVSVAEPLVDSVETGVAVALATVPGSECSTEPVVAVSVGAATDRVACPPAQARACEAQPGLATVAAAVVATPGCPQHALPDGVGHGTPSESPLAAAPVESAIRNPQSAIEPTKRVRPPAISKLTGKRIEAPALKTPEFLREHGLDPADYGGGRSDDPGPIWITGPDPEEVLSRDTSRMNAEEYSQYLKDIAIMKAYGSYREPDRRKPIVMHDKHYYR